LINLIAHASQYIYNLTGFKIQILIAQKEDLTMVVTATDLKTNLGKYLDLLDTDDIIVTRNGRKVARLIRDEEDVLAEVQSLYGILASSSGTTQTSTADLPEERLVRYGNMDWYERSTQEEGK